MLNTQISGIITTLIIFTAKKLLSCTKMEQAGVILIVANHYHAVIQNSRVFFEDELKRRS